MEANKEQLEAAGWKEADIRRVFSIPHHKAEMLAEHSRTREGQLTSREPLLFTRAEVNEELLQGDEYGRTTTRINYYIGALFQDGDGAVQNHVGRLHHFLRVPHPDCDPEDTPPLLVEPLRIAIVTFYKTCPATALGKARVTGPAYKLRAGEKPPSKELRRLIRVDLNATDGECYPTDPQAINNKYVVALPEGASSKEVFCMAYAGLTGTR